MQRVIYLIVAFIITGGTPQHDVIPTHITENEDVSQPLLLETSTTVCFAVTGLMNRRFPGLTEGINCSH